jgi:aminotransferase
MVHAFAVRRKLLMRSFDDAGLRCVSPRGAFYCFARSPDPENDLAALLIKTARVATVRGDAFGAQGSGFARFSLTSKQVEEAARRISRLKFNHIAS